MAIVAVLLVLIVANLIVAHTSAKYVRNNLHQLVEEVTEGLYDLEIGDLNISLMDGHLIAKDISLLINEEKKLEMLRGDTLPPYYTSIRIDAVRLTGINFKYKWKLGKSIGFRHLIIDNMQMALVTDLSSFKEMRLISEQREGETHKALTPYDFIAPYFDELRIDEIKLRGGAISYLDRDGNETLRASIGGLNITANNFKVNADRTLNNSLFYTDNIVIGWDSLKFTPADRLYTYFTGATTLDMVSSNLTIRDAGFTSIEPKWQFAHKDPKHSDWFDLKVDQVSLYGIDIPKVLRDKHFLADSLLVKGVSLHNFKNTQIPIAHNLMPMIYTVVQELPVRFAFQIARVEEMEVVYEELAMGEVEPGRIFLNHLNGTFEDYTNIVSRPKQTTTLHATGRLMGEGRLKATIILPVDPEYDRITLEASLGVMNMISLNPIIETMAPFRIDGGFIQGMNLWIDASSLKSKVRMKLLYNDLSVNITHTTGNHHKSNIGILSFLANGLIENDNPAKGKEVRIVDAVHLRDPLHSSFNYLWKTIFDALVKVLGYTDSRQEKVEWVKKQLAIDSKQ